MQSVVALTLLIGSAAAVPTQAPEKVKVAFYGGACRELFFADERGAFPARLLTLLAPLRLTRVRPLWCAVVIRLRAEAF